MNFDRDLKILEMRQRGDYIVKHKIDFKDTEEGLEKLKNDLVEYKKQLVNFANDNKALNTEKTK